MENYAKNWVIVFEDAQVYQEFLNNAALYDGFDKVRKVKNIDEK